MKSKILLICSLISFFSCMLQAQPVNDEARKNQLFGEPLQFNGFGGPVVAFSVMEGKYSVAPGAMGGIIVNKKYFISLYGQTVVTSHPRPDHVESGPTVYTEVKANMWQTGVWFGYIHKPEKVIHYGISSMIARGQLFLMAKDPATLETREIYDDRVYFITPKIFIEMNISKWLKMNVSAGYRFTGKVNGKYTNQFGEVLPTFYASDYNQPEFSVSMLFGGFSPKSKSN